MLEALSTTANAVQSGYDYAAAAPLYERAITVADMVHNYQSLLAARAAFAVSQVTVDPNAAARIIDAALADKTAMALIDKMNLAYLEDLRARAAMNAGNLQDAETWIMRAVNHSGGLSTRINLPQVAIRSDAAIIASLRKDDESTRKYLTYTGAGHLKSIEWVHQYAGELPVCAAMDVRPDDNVVVQFSIADDGHVTEATPIYANRPGLLGATFAQAVSQWQWDPAALIGIDAFWRHSLVLQLRCQSRPSPIDLGKPVFDAMGAWLIGKGVDTSDHPDSYVSATDSRLALDTPAAIPALFGRMASLSAEHKKIASRARATGCQRRATVGLCRTCPGPSRARRL